MSVPEPGSPLKEQLRATARWLDEQAATTDPVAPLRPSRVAGPPRWVRYGATAFAAGVTITVLVLATQGSPAPPSAGVTTTASTSIPSTTLPTAVSSTAPTSPSTTSATSSAATEEVMRISKTYTSPTPIDRTTPSLSGFLLEPPPVNAQPHASRAQIEALLEPGRGTPMLRFGSYTGPAGNNGPTTLTERELVWVAMYPGAPATRACTQCAPAAPAVQLVVISDATQNVLTGAVLPQAPDLG